MVLKKTIPFVILLAACTRVSVTISPEPEVLKDSTCLVSALATDNNQSIVLPFTLEQDTELVVIGQGEGISYSLTPGFVESYLNDCIEFFIDSDSICRQYRFVWDSSIVQGNNVDMAGVSFAQGDPDDNTYLFEVSFPWRTLGYMNVPSEGRQLRLDVSIIDNDAQSRKSQIAWSGTDANLFQDWSQFGEFNLSDAWTAGVPIIDGVIDDVWETHEWHRIEHEIVGSVNGADDLSGRFRIICDRENLYLLVEVTDDAKRQAAFMFDKGRIETYGGDIVWEMDFGKTSHAGGALKNRMQIDTVSFKAGDYMLIYETDESHSFGHWDDMPPVNQFSGIKISLLKHHST